MLICFKRKKIDYLKNDKKIWLFEGISYFQEPKLFGFIFENNATDMKRGEFVWLPTGDQLDEEIIKICKENKWHYDISYRPDGMVFIDVFKAGGYLMFTHNNINSLI